MLLKPAENEMAYFKGGLFGREGSGKTWTAALIAMGLHKQIKSKKPVSFFDTETGSSFVIHLFKNAGIELLVARSRSLTDLNTFIKESQENCDISIIDSITHPWQAEVKAYKKKTGYSFLRIQDWGPLKETWWDMYSTPYVESKLHIIMCGRSANVFEDVSDEDPNGRKSFKAIKVGTKMKTETDTGYEPSLLLEMEKVMLKAGGKYVRRCHVVKDRFGVIDSKDFDDPTFENFLPHIELLNLGGKHNPFAEEETTSDEDLFTIGGDNKRTQQQKQIKISLEKISEGLVSVFPASQGKDRVYKLAALEELTGTRSWTEIEIMHYDDLKYFSKVIDRLAYNLKNGTEFKDEPELRKLIRKIQKELKDDTKKKAA